MKKIFLIKIPTFNHLKTVITALFLCVYLCVCMYVYVCGDQKTSSGVLWHHLSCSETEYLISLGLLN